MASFVQIVGLFCGALGFHYLVTFLIQKAKHNDLVNKWILALLFAAQLPAQVAVWIASLFISYDLFSQMYGLPHFGSALIIQKLIVTISFSWFLFRVRFLYENLAKELHKNKELLIDPTLLSVLSKLSITAIVLFSVIALLHIAGIPLESLMFFGGAISLAVGLAAQNVIANFFGGMMVYINRPFCVGDRITSADKEIEGLVEEIGWYSTRICTFDRKILYVPNSLFTQILLTNVSRMYNRRIRTTVALRYQDADKIASITQEITGMLEKHPEIDQAQYLMVDWVAFGEYSLDIDVYAFTKTTDWKAYRAVQQDVFIKIVKIVDGHGAEIAFPTRDVRGFKE